ncbi:MAG: radical SAM protein [Thiohalomonadales bacterium]
MKEISSKVSELHDVDVLFVVPGCRASVYQQLANKFSAIEPPVLAGLYATYMRNKGMSTDIIDASVFNLSPDAVADIVCHHYRPILVAVVVYGFQPSASTQNMTAAGETCRAIKELNADTPIIITGTHPAALPNRTLVEESVDFVCDREGPLTIYKTAQVLQSKKLDFHSVPSLWYRLGGVVLSNEPASLMGNLDVDMSIPAWDLLPMEKYRAHNWHCFDHINKRQPYASIYTSLGCPYRCSFCCINAPFGKPSYRMWSPETVINQIDVLVKDYGISNIKISDEMFVLNRSHVHGICDLLIERDYNLNIWAYARIDTVKDEYLDKLARAGFRWLALGIESGSSLVRDGVEKGRFDSTEIIETIRKIQCSGINVIGNYIFGLPDDTSESMRQTLDLALEAQCEFVNFYSAMAYPGSKLYEQALQENISLPNSWTGYSQHSYDCFPLSTDSLTETQVLKFRDEAFLEYYTNPQYLEFIRHKFSPEVEMHINEMVKIQLERAIC